MLSFDAARWVETSGKDHVNNYIRLGAFYDGGIYRGEVYDIASDRVVRDLAAQIQGEFEMNEFSMNHGLGQIFDTSHLTQNKLNVDAVVKSFDKFISDEAHSRIWSNYFDTLIKMGLWEKP